MPEDGPFGYWARKAGYGLAVLVGTIVLGGLINGYMKEKGLDWEKIGSELAKEGTPRVTGTIKPSPPKVQSTRPRQPTQRELEIQRCEDEREAVRVQWMTSLGVLLSCVKEAEGDFFRQLAPTLFCKSEINAVISARDVRQKAVERKC